MSQINQFLAKGYFIANLDKRELNKLDKVKKEIIILLKKKSKFKIKKSSNYLENFHLNIKKNNLNKIRINIFKKLNKNKFNKRYYDICSKYIEPIVGLENVIQKKINLSIQLPNDDSSLLPVHSDTWAGDSPFEIVVWIPLVDCRKSQSMFILPRNTKSFRNFNRKSFRSEKEIMNTIKNEIKFINIKYGQILVFSQNLPHGNIINKEKKTRWSLNARIKSLMSPYSSKGILDFFDIIKIMPATKLGLNYEYPKFK